MLNRKLMTLFLLVVCLFQAYVIYEALTNFDIEIQTNQGTSTSAANNDNSIMVSQPLKLETINAFKAIKERTLFSQDRKLPEEEKILPKPAPKPKRPARNPGFELTGVYLSTQENIALIKTRDKDKAESVQLDETYQGWTLFELTGDSAKLESQGQQITLIMSKEEKKTSRPSTSQIPTIPDELMMPEQTMMPN